jgi:hypothetical protein
MICRQAVANAGRKHSRKYCSRERQTPNANLHQSTNDGLEPSSYYRKWVVGYVRYV